MSDPGFDARRHNGKTFEDAYVQRTDALAAAPQEATP